MYRFLRCVLCLLVVCCLIVNLSPIKANATAGGLAASIAGAASVTVSAPVAIGAALIALGIMAGTNDDFRRVVGNAVDSLGDWVKDGTVELIQTVDTLGKKAYYVAGDMLEDVRSLCISQEVITPNELVLDSVSYPPADALAEAAAAPYSVLVYHKQTSSGYLSFELAYSYEAPVVAKSTYSDGTGVWIGCENGESGYIWSLSGQFNAFTGVASASNSSKRIISAQEFGQLAAKYITSYDLILGQVSSVPVDGTSAREWSEEYTNRGLYVDPAGDGDGNDEDGKWYWPLVLAPGIESLTQTDQWTGTTADEFDDYETEEEYEVVGTPVVPFGSSVQIKPVTVPGVGDDTEVDSGTTDSTADYTSWFDKIVGFLQNIWDSIKELPSKFADWFEAIIEGIQALPGKFAAWFETIIDGIQAIPDVISGWFTDVIEWLTSIWEAICSIPTLILDGITAIFVPSEDFVTTKVEALRERFSWIEPILGYGDYIKAQLIDPEPPVLYVHLGNAEGSYNYGGTVKFLDLTWYERYKSQGDAIISGFLWALFAWRMYVKLPGIINGVAGDVGHISYGESAWQKVEDRKERKEKGGKNK